MGWPFLFLKIWKLNNPTFILHKAIISLYCIIDSLILNTKKMSKNFYTIKFLFCSFLCLMLFQFGQAQNVGIGVNAPAEKLHVDGNVRVNTLAGTGTRVVGSDANGTLNNVAAGNTGEVLMQTPTGPSFQAPRTINSTSLNADIQISATTWTNVPGMTLTFTATQTDALLMFSASGFAYTNSMSAVQLRVRNGGTSLGGTNTHMQSYDDVTGTITSWSCTYTKKVTGLTIGNTYTYTLQGQVEGILGTSNAAIFTASNPDSHHMTLTVLQ